jgi:dihydroflavonol-4-reductase
MPRPCLVTGANGHLGNNIVRELCARSIPVRAGVRDTDKTAALHGLDCSIMRVDILNEESMIRAMVGVDVVYAVAAVVRLDSRHDPMQEIFDVNTEATRVLLRVAAIVGVPRIVFVSSVAVLDPAEQPMSEQSPYTPWDGNHYYASKVASDVMMRTFAPNCRLDVVTVLPGTLVGGECFALNASYATLAALLAGRVPLDPNLYLNWCDVRDVARACVAAAADGVAGERYVLAQQRGTSVRETVELLRELYPHRRLRLPRRVPKWLLLSLAWVADARAALLAAAASFRSMLTVRRYRRPGLLPTSATTTPANAPPRPQREFLRLFWGVRMDFDNRKAREALGFAPRPVKSVLKDAADYLFAHPQLLLDQNLQL